MAAISRALVEIASLKRGQTRPSAELSKPCSTRSSGKLLGSRTCTQTMNGLRRYSLRLSLLSRVLQSQNAQLGRYGRTRHLPSLIVRIIRRQVASDHFELLSKLVEASRIHVALNDLSRPVTIARTKSHWRRPCRMTAHSSLENDNSVACVAGFESSRHPTRASQ